MHLIMGLKWEAQEELATIKKHEQKHVFTYMA